MFSSLKPTPLSVISNDNISVIASLRFEMKNVYNKLQSNDFGSQMAQEDDTNPNYLPGYRCRDFIND